MRPKGVTIRDVARQALVSYQTVSRVINKDERISPEARERVLRAIEQLGFRPNQIARSLVTKRTNTIALIISDIANPFFPDVVRGTEDVLRPSGYSLVLSNTGDDPEREHECITHMLGKRVDGIILYTRMSAERLAEMSARLDIPLIVLNRCLKGPSHLGLVRTDRETAAFEAVSYLLELGHQRIGLLAAMSSIEGTRERVDGYRRALNQAGIPYDESLVFRESLTMQGGYRSGSHLLDVTPRPTAVLCHDDVMAIGLMQACARRRIKVPRDLSIVGWDDIPYAEVVSPPLTTMRVPRYEMGQAAARMLLALVGGKPHETDTVLPLTLVRRRTCRKLVLDGRGRCHQASRQSEDTVTAGGG